MASDICPRIAWIQAVAATHHQRKKKPGLLAETGLENRLSRRAGRSRHGL